MQQQLCNVPASSELLGICLSDLRLTELIQLKKSIDVFSVQQEICEQNYESENTKVNVNVSTAFVGEPLPLAMALNAESREHGWVSNQELWHEEKPTKLQTFFRIAVTALAFLSFGGYLLCMIVQAIKSKGTTYFYPVVPTSTTFLSNGVKGIKIYRRGR